MKGSSSQGAKESPPPEPKKVHWLADVREYAVEVETELHNRNLKRDSRKTGKTRLTQYPKSSRRARQSVMVLDNSDDSFRTL